MDLVLRYKEHEMKDQYRKCHYTLYITHRVVNHIYRTGDYLMNSTLHWGMELLSNDHMNTV